MYNVTIALLSCILVLQAAQQRQQLKQQTQQKSDSEKVPAGADVVDVAAEPSLDSSKDKQANGISQNGSSRGKQSRKSKQKDVSRPK